LQILALIKVIYSDPSYFNHPVTSVDMHPVIRWRNNSCSVLFHS